MCGNGFQHSHSLPFPSIQFAFPPTPHSQVFDLFPFPWDSRVGYSHSLPIPFPFRVSDRVMVSLGMWNNQKFTRPSIASIRIMSSVYMQISNRKVKSLPRLCPLLFVLLPKSHLYRNIRQNRLKLVSIQFKPVRNSQKQRCKFDKLTYLSHAGQNKIHFSSRQTRHNRHWHLASIVLIT